MSKGLFYSGLGFFLLEILVAGFYFLSQISVSRGTLIGVGILGLNLLAAIFMLVGALNDILPYPKG